MALKQTPPEGQVAFSTQHVPVPSPMLFAGQPCTVLENGAEIKNGDKRKSHRERSGDADGKGVWFRAKRKLR